MKSFIPFGSPKNDAPSTSANSFHGLWAQNGNWAATSATKQMPIAKACTVTAISIETDTAPGATKTWTFQLVVNGTLTGPTWVIADSAVRTGEIRLPTPLSLNAGDTLCLMCAPANTPTVTAGIYGYLILESSGGYPQGTSNAGNANVLCWLPPFGFEQATITTAESLAATPIPVACTIQNLYAKLNLALTSGSFDVTLMKNGVATALTLNLSSADGTNVDSDTNGAHAVSFAAGDTASIRMTPNTPSNARTLLCGFEIVPTDPDVAIFGGAPQGADNASTTRYNGPFGAGFAWGTTENVAPRMKVPKIALLAMRVSRKTAPGNTKSSTLHLRTNFANSVANALVDDLNTAAVGTITTPGVTDADVLTVSVVPLTLPAVSIWTWAVAYKIPPDSNFLEVF